MKSRVRLRRIAMALGISVLLNVALFTAGSTVDANKWPPSWKARVLEALVTPGATVTMWVLPGHDAIQVVLLILSSVLFYGIIAWAAISMWEIIRRTGPPRDGHKR